MTQAADAKVRLSLEDKITSPIKVIKALFTELSQSLKLDKATDSAKKLARSIKGIGLSLRQAASRLSIFTGLIGIAGGGLIAGLSGASLETAKLGAELDKASKRFGMGVVDLQLWQSAAKKSGMEASQFNSALANLNRKSIEAAKGNKQSAEAFKELGISVKDSSGKLKTNKALIEEVATKMGKIGSNAKRERLASMLFGGDGKEMSTMMSKGMDGINDLFNETRKAGNLLGKDVATAGAALTGNISKLQERLKGLKNFIGAQLIPIFNDIVKGITTWVDANRELIKQKISEWVERLKNLIIDLKNPNSELRKSIEGVIESIKGWLSWLEPITGELSGFKVILMAAAAFIVGPLVAALATAGMAFVSLGITIMTTPIGWIMAGIAGLVAAGYYLYKNWDSVCDWISGVWGGFVSSLSNIWNGFVDWIMGIFGNITSAFDEGFIQGILNLLRTFDPLTIIANAINSVVEWLFGVNLKDAGSNLINSMWDGIKSMWANVDTWVKGAIAKLTGWMPNWMKNKLGLNVKAESTTTTKTVQDLGFDIAQIATNAQQTAIPQTTTALASQNQVSNTNPRQVETAKVETQEVVAQSFHAPEPLLVHKPSQVDASVTVQNLTINGGNGTPEEINAAINRALAGHANAQRAALTSSLTD